MKSTYIIVLVATSSKEEAEKITRHLLDLKLIACGNIVGPISSIFRWSGKIEDVKEYFIVMKSQEELFEKLSSEVEALHSYTVPEILALPIVKGSKNYLNWLESCLK